MRDRRGQQRRGRRRSTAATMSAAPTSMTSDLISARIRRRRGWRERRRRQPHGSVARSRPLEQQIGGEGDEHDRRAEGRAVATTASRRLDAVVDRRVGERQPGDEPAPSGDRQAVEQLARPRVPRAGRAAASSTPTTSTTPTSRSPLPVHADVGACRRRRAGPVEREREAASARASRRRRRAGRCQRSRQPTYDRAHTTTAAITGRGERGRPSRRTATGGERDDASSTHHRVHAVRSRLIPSFRLRRAGSRSSCRQVPGIRGFEDRT